MSHDVCGAGLPNKPTQKPEHLSGNIWKTRATACWKKHGVHAATFFKEKPVACHSVPLFLVPRLRIKKQSEMIWLCSVELLQLDKIGQWVIHWYDSDVIWLLQKNTMFLAKDGIMNRSQMVCRFVFINCLIIQQCRLKVLQPSVLDKHVLLHEYLFHFHTFYVLHWMLRECNIPWSLHLKYPWVLPTVGRPTS